MVDRGVRLRTARRCVRHWLVDAAAEEEPRHRRARARQGRAPHRRPHRLSGDPQIAAARVQPRSAGGQGAAVRRARHVQPVAACADGFARQHRVRRAADDGRRRQSLQRRDRPRRAPRAAGHAVPGGARDHRRVGASVDRTRGAARGADLQRPAPRARLVAVARTGKRGAPAHDSGRRGSRSRSRVSSNRPRRAWSTSRRGSNPDAESSTTATHSRSRRSC